MSSILYEIVELSGGEIVLQRADGEGQPLVRIQFSTEARAYINGASVEVARAMIEAGIESASELFEDAGEDANMESEAEPSENLTPSRLLH